ncbi:MAG: hypothetical protein ACF8MF_01625 [Phycisphaerales bacterium JB052]
MKYHVTLFLICGSASLAGAQDFSLWLEPSSMTPNGTFTVSVYGDADVGTAYLSGAFGLSVESVAGENQVSNITWDLPLNGLFQYFDYGYGGNGTHLGTSFYQLIVPSCGMIFDCGISYGELIGSFTIEMDPHAMGDYEISLLSAPDLDLPVPHTFAVYDEMTGHLYNDSQGTLTLTGTTVTVVPAPAGLGSLLFCGLLASRRTRKEVRS